MVTRHNLPTTTIEVKISSYLFNYQLINLGFRRRAIKEGKTNMPCHSQKAMALSAVRQGAIVASTVSRGIVGGLQQTVLSAPRVVT
jgi:hypothetical protein